MQPFRFERQVREEKVETKRVEQFTASIADYDAVVTIDRDHLTQLSIAPRQWGGMMRLGIFQCYPKYVADLEAFAEQSRELLLGIASAMREAGLDDLRNESDRRHDKWQADLEAERAKREKA